MRILFYVIGNSRRSNYLTGDNIRYGGASASGTDTSAILVAEYLASVGHEVVFACENTNIGEISRGVVYTDLSLGGIDKKEFDILVSMLWVGDYNSIPATITKGVIYWSHMQWIYGIGELISYCTDNNLKLGVVHISEWEKLHNNSTVEHALTQIDIKTAIIPNPVADDVVAEVNNMQIQRNPHKFIFHATWARGGRVVYDVVDTLDFENKELHAFDYLMNIDINWGRESPIEEGKFLKKHGGVDKSILFKHLAESEYFVYPLYTPYQDVHKDTFSCVVAEAIAMGCIVITYPLGAVPEYFGEHCIWLDFPEGFTAEEMQRDSLSKDYDGVFTHIDGIINKINYLENNSHIKDKIRATGTEYIISNFGVNKVGNMWIKLLNELGV
jgi:glycosyltransferase involved in cell wall biosynthesis